MSRIPFLVQLPSAWFVAFLSDWLDMPSIGMLDTAMSSKTHRSQFLANLQTMRSTGIDSFSGICGRYLGGKWTRRWWRWLSIRHIYVESIVLRGNAVISEMVIPSMRKAVTKSFEDEDLHYLVRNCPSLQSLSLESYSNRMNLTAFRILTNLHRSLEELSFCRSSNYIQPESYYTQSAAAFIDMLRCCSRLHKVSLTGDALRSVNLEELLPYSNLFHEL
jgi:hypothetical protein